MGGGGVSAPKPVTLSESIGDVTNTASQVFGTESKYQPQYQALGNQLSGNNMDQFISAMGTTAVPNAASIAGQQEGYNLGLLNQYGQQAGAATMSANPFIGQGAQAAGSLINQGQTGALQSGQMFGTGQRQINQGMANPQTLQGLNNTVNQNLSGALPSSVTNAISQGTGATFAANGLFNSNPANASNLLNQANYEQARQQQWASIGSQVQGLNLGQQQAGTSEQQAGSQLFGASALSQNFGLGGLQNSAGQLQGGIQSIVNPNQLNANLSSFASAYNPGNVTPQLVPQLLGTSAALNETNSQGQFAASSANAQLQSSQNSAMLSAGGSAAIASASIAASFA
jgi:hypothetical protein